MINRREFGRNGRRRRSGARPGRGTGTPANEWGGRSSTFTFIFVRAGGNSRISTERGSPRRTCSHVEPPSNR